MSRTARTVTCPSITSPVLVLAGRVPQSCPVLAGGTVPVLGYPLPGTGVTAHLGLEVPIPRKGHWTSGSILGW